MNKTPEGQFLVKPGYDPGRDKGNEQIEGMSFYKIIFSIGFDKGFEEMQDNRDITPLHTGYPKETRSQTCKKS